jgi:non-heme chloroperoxidase
MGGGEVVRYFSKFGGKGVTKAVLISSITPYMLKTPDNPDGVPQEMFDKMLGAMKEDRIAFLDDFGKTFFGVSLLNNNISDQSLNYYLNVCSKHHHMLQLNVRKVFHLLISEVRWQQSHVPTLIIHGDKDETVPIKPTALEATKVIKNNKLIVYEGEPHGIWFTQKERLNKDLDGVFT